MTDQSEGSGGTNDVERAYATSRIREMEERENVRNVDVSRYSVRLMTLGVLCLIVVILVMAFALVFAATIAGNAQDSADRQNVVNDSLREELACRARGATDFDLALGRLQAAIARALLDLQDQEKIAEDQAKIAKEIDSLETAAVVREKTLSECVSRNE